LAAATKDDIPRQSRRPRPGTQRPLKCRNAGRGRNSRIESLRLASGLQPVGRVQLPESRTDSQTRLTGVAKCVMLSVMSVAPTGGLRPYSDLERHRKTNGDNQSNCHEKKKIFLDEGVENGEPAISREITAPTVVARQFKPNGNNGGNGNRTSTSRVRRTIRSATRGNYTLPGVPDAGVSARRVLPLVSFLALCDRNRRTRCGVSTSSSLGGKANARI